MLADMDVDDYREWQEFSELEPFGAVQDGLYFGLIASLLYNANRGKNSKALNPEDFFPHVKRLTMQREQTPEQMRRIAMLAAWKSGGRIGKQIEPAGKDGEPSQP